jgi:hypothetical protein
MLFGWRGGGRMVLNAIFNNISVISWRSVLLLQETTGVPGENHRSAGCHWQTLSHSVAGFDITCSCHYLKYIQS